MISNPTVLTQRQLCDRLQVSDTTIQRLRAEGIIKPYRIRARIRFVLEEVLEALALAERDLPLRRLRGTLLESGGPDRRLKIKEKKTGLVKANATDITADEFERIAGTSAGDDDKL